jgi:hypothetical protein
MPAWLPVIKAAIPHIAQIVSVALPMFTARSPSVDRDALTAQQIDELQQAATQNAASVHELALQLKTTFESMEVAAADLQARVRRQQQLTFITLIVALLAVFISFYTLATLG